MDDKPVVAFYGATGGCCAAALAKSLNAGYSCTALARSPEKLENILRLKGISDTVLSSQLIITKGDIRDTTAVSGTLVYNNTVASIIISGIGATPPYLNAVTLCADATKSIFMALRRLKPIKKPLFVLVSTTGITNGKRDVPLLYRPFNNIFSFRPNADKRNAEKVTKNEMKYGVDALIDGYIIVRPSLLTIRPALGIERVKTGTEDKPAIGYAIHRDDVGGWIFENVIDDNESRVRRMNEIVTITS